MPKAAAPPKVTAIRGAPITGTVKFKTISRGRNKAGRATASKTKTTHEFLPSESTSPPPPISPDPHHEDDPESGGEEVIQLKAQKSRSKAVSVSLNASRRVNPADLPVDKTGRMGTLERGGP